jgi:hypothetical protein
VSRPNINTRLDEVEGRLENIQSTLAQLAAGSLNADMLTVLYGFVARYGLQVPGQPGGVVSTAQVPLLSIPENHTLDYERLEDGSVLVRILNIGEPAAEEPETTTEEPAAPPEELSVDEFDIPEDSPEDLTPGVD